MKIVKEQIFFFSWFKMFSLEPLTKSIFTYIFFSALHWFSGLTENLLSRVFVNRKELALRILV